MIMSLLNDVQKFIEAHPGCTSGDIADAFAGYSRQRVLQSASKLRQSGRVAHRCEGDTRRHFPRLTERAQEPEPQPVRETRPVRNFYVGTNDPRVILCLTRQAEELESRGLYRRAATVWMAAFRESHSQPERNNFLARRERCLRKSSKRAASGEEWWPEDADHIAFIRGRIGFELPAWFIPKDEKQVPTGAFFAGAIAVFDKTWKGPAISYIGRDELEACGEAFLAQVRQQAEKLVREMAA
ncbi:PerC family transcriptional regulator [Escherichia coli]|nr:PerC family transcriptional regulator [Escherichia coli]EFB1881507.1 PerC family transcriptional regulator [Escherichia coli]EFJ2534960.1 PerC family transcriptional regulator [Escherichia coli]